MKNRLQKIITGIGKRWAKTSEKRFTCWLRKKGCKIGERVRWYGLPDITIDTTRPCLIEIGDDVCFTRGCTVLTHGADWQVLRNVYGELLGSSGRVKIGNNVFMGTASIVLKGVTIGDNCIVGAGSLVTRDVPPFSVAAGNPARVIYHLEEYYRLRKNRYVDEAKAYASSIKRNLNRRPVPADFWEEFPLFMKGGVSIKGVPARHQLGRYFETFCMSHHPLYETFDDFIKDTEN